MAGKPGRSGGYRPGAGRKKEPPKPLDVTPPAEAPEGESVAYDDPKPFLRAVMNDQKADARLRVDAAKALMPYLHQKKGETGKKGERAGAAEKAAQGKFTPARPPRLVSSR